MALSDIIGSVGGRAFISASLPTAATRLAYEALPWTEIGLISDLGSIGKTFSETTFTPAKEAKVVPKLTSSDNGEAQLVYAYTAGSDAGHAILAARLGKRVSICFALPNGKCKYFQAFVKSEVVNLGTVDNIVTETCGLRLTEDDIVRADTPWWFADDSPYWWFAGHAGFFTDLNPVYGKAFTTAAGNGRAINPGDPVGRVESIAGGLTLKQPSSPLRPMLARVPKGVGITNRFLHTENLLSGYWVSAGATRDVSGWFETGVSGEHYSEVVTSYRPIIPAGAVVYVEYVVSRRGLPGRNCRLSLIDANSTTTNASASFDLGLGIVSGAAGNGGAAIVTPPSIESNGDGSYTIGFAATVGSATTLIVRVAGLSGTSPTYEGNSASGLNIGRCKLNINGSYPYQTVGNAWDVTQPGIEDDWYIYGNGTQHMTFGVQSFGTASLFAAAGQTWTAGARIVALPSSANRTVLGKSQAGSASATLREIIAASGGVKAVNARGTSTNTAAVVTDGKPHQCASRWDGSLLTQFVDGVGSSATPGSAPVQNVNITFLAHDESAPADIATAYAVPFLIGKALSAVEIARIAA